MNSLFLYVDESGDFTFSNYGSQYFILTCLSTTNPFGLKEPLDIYRTKLLSLGIDIEEFHANENAKQIRDNVFEILSNTTAKFAIHAIIVNKRHVKQSFQYVEKLYPIMMDILLNHAIPHYDILDFDALCIITDQIPVKRKNKIIIKSIKQNLSNVTANQIPFHLYHHDSKSNYYLQAVDYYGWALNKKFRDNRTFHYNLIKDKIRNEVIIFEDKPNYY